MSCSNVTSSSSSDDSSEDSEDTIPRKIQKVENFLEDIVQSYSNNTFKNHFRMSRTVAYELIGMVVALIHFIIIKILTSR